MSVYEEVEIEDMDFDEVTQVNKHIIKNKNIHARV